MLLIYATVRSNVGRRWRPSKARSSGLQLRSFGLFLRRTASEPAAVVPHIFIETGCGCYFRRRPDVLLVVLARRSAAGIMACKTLGSIALAASRGSLRTSPKYSLPRMWGAEARFARDRTGNVRNVTYTSGARRWSIVQIFRIYVTQVNTWINR